MAVTEAVVQPQEMDNDRTDLGNTILFAQQYKDEIRYDHLRKRWLIWNGHYWKPDHGPMLVQRVMAFVQAKYMEATAEEISILNPKERRKTIHWGNANSERGIGAITRMSPSISFISDDGHEWDAIPYLLGVTNGVVDLRTGELRDGQPKDRITKRTKVLYDPLAKADRWEAFLTEIHPDDHDGVAIREYLHRAYGYSATGESRDHILMTLIGTGRNGKSVERNAIHHVLGDYGVTLSFQSVERVHGLRPTNDMAALYRNRMAISSEANKGSVLDTSRIKTLTGEDPISARFLHKEFFEFTNTAKIWVAVNDKPDVKDDSEGFWERVRAVTYPVQFEGAKADRTLGDTFHTAEARGILAWLVRGAVKYYESGLGDTPVSITETTNGYRSDNDPISEFISDRMGVYEGGTARWKDIVQEFTTWADDQGLTQKERPPNKALKSYLGIRYREHKDNRGKLYKGVYLSSHPPLELDSEPTIPPATYENFRGMFAESVA